MYCNQCGSHIGTETTHCLYCGAPNRNIQQTGFSPGPMTPGQKFVLPSHPPKNPLLMGFLTGCCITGLGQIILGQTVKGIVLLVGSIVLYVATSGLGFLLVAPLLAVDAYLIAKKLEAGNPVGEWEFF